MSDPDRGVGAATFRANSNTINYSTLPTDQIEYNHFMKKMESLKDPQQLIIGDRHMRTLTKNFPEKGLHIYDSVLL